jgi:hypothetical protein
VARRAVSDLVGAKHGYVWHLWKVPI